MKAEKVSGDEEVVYLATDHDVSDFGFAVAAVRLVVSCTDRQNEIPRMALALSHEEAAVLPFLRQQLLSLPARQVPVEPSGKKKKTPNGEVTTGLNVLKNTSHHETPASNDDGDKRITLMASLSLFIVYKRG